MDIFFYLFAALTLICGLLVVANPFSRNPVTSAMFLVLTILSMAGLFVLLNAFFLAAVQVIVYAGAVIVLYLFVIMLLDLGADERRRLNKAMVGLSFLGVGLLAFVLVSSIGQSEAVGALSSPRLQGTTEKLGKALFSDYVLPFEVVSVVLLVAMVGIILLSKRDLK